MAFPRGSWMEACSGRSPLGTGRALTAGTTKYGAKAPWLCTPKMLPCSQMWAFPSKQRGQVQQARWHSMATRSPTFRSVTPSPKAAISPHVSCPVTVPSGTFSRLHSSHFQMCKSVPQMLVALVRTRTSPFPGVGTGCSTRSNPSASSRTLVHAIIVPRSSTAKAWAHDP